MKRVVALFLLCAPRVFADDFSLLLSTRSDCHGRTSFGPTATQDQSGYYYEGISLAFKHTSAFGRKTGRMCQVLDELLKPELVKTGIPNNFKNKDQFMKDFERIFRRLEACVQDSTPTKGQTLTCSGDSAKWLAIDWTQQAYMQDRNSKLKLMNFFGKIKPLDNKTSFEFEFHKSRFHYPLAEVFKTIGYTKLRCVREQCTITLSQETPQFDELIRGTPKPNVKTPPEASASLVQ